MADYILNFEWHCCDIEALNLQFFFENASLFRKSFLGLYLRINTIL
jgi:hypothetical protein